MLSTSTVWGRATHTTDPSSGRLCVHTRLTADLVVPRYSACDLNQYIPPSAHKAFTSKTRHVWSRSNEWQWRACRVKHHTPTHTCRVKVCSAQRGPVRFQVVPSWWDWPGRREERRSWLRGFCRACRLLQETGCSGSLGSWPAWNKQRTVGNREKQAYYREVINT